MTDEWTPDDPRPWQDPPPADGRWVEVTGIGDAKRTWVGPPRMTAEQAAAWRKAFSQIREQHNQAVITSASFGFTPLPPLKRRISELAAARQAWLDPAGDDIDAADEKLLEFLAALDQAKTVTALDAAAAPPWIQVEPYRPERPDLLRGSALPMTLLAVGCALLAMPWAVTAWLGQLFLALLVIRGLVGVWQLARVVRARLRRRG